MGGDARVGSFIVVILSRGIGFRGFCKECFEFFFVLVFMVLRGLYFYLGKYCFFWKWLLWVVGGVVNVSCLLG